MTKDSRLPLGTSAQFMVVTEAILIILANTMLHLHRPKLQPLELSYRESLIDPSILNQSHPTNSTNSDHNFDAPFCRILTAGTWLSVTTSVYTFTVVSFVHYMGAVHETLFEHYFSHETAYKFILTC